MRRNNNLIKTTFGTALKPINTNDGVFVLTKDAKVMIDTPLQNKVGTEKTFLKDSVVKGTLWRELAPRAMKSRKVVMVQDDDGRYLISAWDLKPTTQAEIDAKKEIDKLGNKVDELMSQAKDEASKLTKKTEGFMDKKYAGFTGKQILVASVGVIVLIKLFK
jgi:hypothetical protein